MNVHVLGAGRDVGRSCLLLTISTSRILLDCGAHPGYADARRFPDLASLGADTLSTLDAVLISHFHLDHAAALPLLTETLHCRAPVYMTEPTRDLARLMLRDFLATSAARRQTCPFSAADVDACLSRVSLLRLGETEMVGRASQIAVTPYYAGHVLGAVMLHVAVAGRSVLYSGDYSTRSDRHLRSACVPFGLKPDLFITEATYCSTARKEGHRQQEDVVMKAVTEAVAIGGKVLVPISAFGRVQAVCAMFSAHPDGHLLRDVPIYIVSGLASKANLLYQRFTEWTVQDADEGISSGGARCDGDGRRPHSCKSCPFISRLKSFNRNEHWDLLHDMRPMILFATPGNLSTGLSRDVFNRWAEDSKNVIVVPSFNFSNTLTSKLLSGHRSVDNDIQVEVNCRLVNMAFNSHADARGIVRTCRQVMARSVMLVHGEENKIVSFRKQLMDALSIKCFAPTNNEIVTVPNLPNRCAGDSGLMSSSPAQQLPTKWRAVIDAYLEQVERHVEQPCNYP